MTNAVTKKAKKALRYFTTDTRVNGERFVKAENAPSWLQTLIREAHGDMMPNDWVYDVIHDVLNAIIDNEENEDAMREACTEADVYNSDLLRWLADNLYNAEYVNEAVQEYGLDSKNFDLYQAVRYGQSRAKDEIFNTIFNGLVALVEA